MIRRAFAVLLVVTAPVLGAQEQVFSGSVPSGSWLRIRNYKGDVRVSETSGSTVTVSARRRDDNTRFEIKRDGNNVTICATTEYTTRCDARGYSSHSTRRDQTISRSDLTVSLPRGLKLLASTGNGDVDIRGAGEEVSASSGNGEVNVSGARGRVSASTGNGEIRVEYQPKVRVHDGSITGFEGGVDGSFRAGEEERQEQRRTAKNGNRLAIGTNAARASTAISLMPRNPSWPKSLISLVRKRRLA